MIVKKIYTNNIDITKDCLIRIAIKLGLQYIDIDNEVHIEGNIYRFYDNSIINIESSVELPIINIENEITLLKEKRNQICELNDFTLSIDKIEIHDKKQQFKKQDYMNESRKTKSIIKKRGIK